MTGSHCSVLNIINKVSAFSDRAQPGGWNDLDMLEVGNGGMTDDEVRCCLKQWKGSMLNFELQYKAHFSMWAALKSPLLIGTDIRKLSSATLTILNNPAVIAISQDPLGRSIAQVRRDTDGLKKDKYGMGETQVWSGHLSGGDEVVVLFNAADEDVEMTASLEEIFYADGPEGSAEAVHKEWEVYDLWANRMDSATAQKILDAGETIEASEKLFQGANWYNATALSYQDGLKANDPRLLGKFVGIIQPRGVLKFMVKRHSAEMFRLRSSGGEARRYISVRDEL